MTADEARVLAYLREAGIPYAHAAHAAVNAISQRHFAQDALGGCMPRNLFLSPRNQSAHYLCIAHPDSPFRTGDVSRQAGASRLSFAPEDALARLLRARPGAVSPLGLIFDEGHEVKLLVDERLLREDALLFHPLVNTASVRLQTADFLGRFLPGLGCAPRFVRMCEGERI